MMMAGWLKMVPQSLHQASLQNAGVPHDSPLEGQLLCDFALITPSKTGRCLLIFFRLEMEPGPSCGCNVQTP